MRAEDYAKALCQLEAKPEHIAGLRDALKRRGHLKLFPRILAEYEKLQLRERRLKKQKEVTPEGERTRVLLELYRTLIATPTTTKN
jgi:hypothetical protein